MATGEKITDKEFIYTLLKRLQQHKTLLSVSIPLVKDIYNSAILKINADKSAIVLDELHPIKGHQQFLKIKSIQINSHTEGIGLTFDCDLIKVNLDEEISKYLISFPKHLWYKQQRETYRVQIAADLQFPVQLYRDDQHQYEGLVIDICHTGVCIKFEHFLPFEVGDQLNHCNISLPAQDKIQCGLIVKHIVHTEQPVTTQIGAKLIDLEGNNRKAYLQTIANLQREMIRRKNKVNPN